jgi:hypothetical protein
MKWGHRKAKKLEAKARLARESAKEWDEISKYQTKKLRAKGKIDKADARERKYKEFADSDRADARRYEERAAIAKKEDKFREARKDVGAKRSTGSKVATLLLGGPFANKTYNSVIAAGGSKVGAIGTTAVATMLGGPVGNLIASSIITREAATGNTTKKY